MRTGTCTVQQALTAEAASVLKHSLSLARRRGHAQVTPLHVAATLLTSSSISSSNLLRRACLKSHPHHPASHPLQCRALELCFNVALNRLPTTPPPSSGSLIHPHPSLSNALIAALKRAQAHQRRGCIEQQQVQPQAHHLQNQQQQQPLLALKVELEQLIISILDDPSVSRVMREAGFSSTSVKSNIEEDCTSPPRPPPQSSSFFFDPHRDFITHFLNPPPPQTNPGLKSFPEEDLKVVMEVMLRKQGKRSNTVVVGDSVTMTEGLVAELKRMVENGEVPDELKSAHFISLHLSYIHLRLMSRGDVEMKLSDIKAKMCSLERGGGGIIINAGDLRWAVDEETGGSCFRPVDHMISELGKLLFEMKSTNESGRVWLLATASYQTYMKCQMKQPSLESQWSLQAVVVPSGGLVLSLQSPSALDSRVPKLSQYPFQMLEPKAFSLKDEEDKLSCCAECTSSYEKEASVLLQSDPKANSSSSSHLPYWLQPHKTDNHHKDAALVELRRKWNRLCRNLRHVNQIHLFPPLFNQSLIGKNYMYTPSHPWWGSTSLSCNQAKIFGGTRSISLPNSPPRANPESPDCIAQLQTRLGDTTEKEAKLPWLSESSLNTLKRSLTMDVRTTLALGSPLFSDSATSKDQRECFRSKKQELTQLLQDNIPWQSEAIPSIVEALLNCRLAEKKGTWLLIQGNDHIGKRRLARSISEANLFNLVKASKASFFANTFTEALKKDPRCVFLIEGIDENFLETLLQCHRDGFIKDSYGGKEVNLAHCIFILSTSNSTEEQCSVLNMRLLVEEISPDACMIKDRKRKQELRSSPNVSKKSRSKDIDIDLNVCVQDGYKEEEEEEEQEDGVPSDLTQESDGSELNLPQDILEAIDASFTLHTNLEQSSQVTKGIESKLRVAFEEACGGDRRLRIDPEVAEAMDSLSASEVERWVKEVFQATVGRKGGKVVRLSVEGRMGNVMDCGFMGSVLPNRIHLGD